MNSEPTFKTNYYGRWLRWTAVALLTLIFIIILLITTGFFDPSSTETNHITIRPTTLTIAPQNKQIIWQAPIPTLPYSIKLNAALQSGEVDSGYGLLLGTENEHFGIAVAPTGYLTVWQTGKQETIFLPWQTWPHVQTGNSPNEIWLDMAADGLATVRVNREFLWSDEIVMPMGEVGVYGESFGETAVIDFQSP